MEKRRKGGFRSLPPSAKLVLEREKGDNGVVNEGSMKNTQNTHNYNKQTVKGKRKVQHNKRYKPR